MKEDEKEMKDEAQLEDDSPEGAASDGKGKIFVNNERKNTIQVLDGKKMIAIASWPLDLCDGPTWIPLGQ